MFSLLTLIFRYYVACEETKRDKVEVGSRSATAWLSYRHTHPLTPQY